MPTHLFRDQGTLVLDPAVMLVAITLKEQQTYISFVLVLADPKRIHTTFIPPEHVNRQTITSFEVIDLIQWRWEINPSPIKCFGIGSKLCVHTFRMSLLRKDSGGDRPLEALIIFVFDVDNGLLRG